MPHPQKLRLESEQEKRVKILEFYKRIYAAMKQESLQQADFQELKRIKKEAKEDLSWGDLNALFEIAETLSHTSEMSYLSELLDWKAEKDWGAFFTALEYGDVALMREVVNSGCVLRKGVEIFPPMILGRAISNYHLNSAQTLLADAYGNRLFSKMPHTFLLFYAIGKRHSDLAKWMISEFCDVLDFDAKNEIGQSLDEVARDQPDVLNLLNAWRGSVVDGEIIQGAAENQSLPVVLADPNRQSASPEVSNVFSTLIGNLAKNSPTSVLSIASPASSSGAVSSGGRPLSSPASILSSVKVGMFGRAVPGVPQPAQITSQSAAREDGSLAAARDPSSAFRSPGK